jgi:DNA polymerase I
MPFQGTAADIMKLAMIKVRGHLDKYPETKMLLQIHDSILIEVSTVQADKLAKEIKQIMENAAKLDVKLTVDTSTGSNWGEL